MTDDHALLNVDVENPFGTVPNIDRVHVAYLPAHTFFACDFKGIARFAVKLKAAAVPSEFADDAVKLDPKHNEVLFENGLVRVVRVHFGPGESGPMVDKRARVIIMLTDSHATVTLPDGHSEVRDGKAGTVSFSKGGRQATNNVGTTELENIVVELKGK